MNFYLPYFSGLREATLIGSFHNINKGAGHQKAYPGIVINKAGNIFYRKRPTLRMIMNDCRVFHLKKINFLYSNPVNFTFKSFDLFISPENVDTFFRSIYEFLDPLINSVGIVSGQRRVVISFFHKNYFKTNPEVEILRENPRWYNDGPFDHYNDISIPCGL